MLEELHITDFALIDEVLIEFGPGLNVLTGETGAGKTILLAALGLLLGERADTDAIRSGAEAARVEGRFRLGSQQDELILARSVSRQGRSKCYVDGSLIAVGTLAQLGDKLVDLHGQHEHQALMKTASHVEYLDRYCGDEQLDRRRRWSDLLARLREVQHEIAGLRQSAAECEQQRELLQFQADEITAVQLIPVEDEDLAASLEVLRNAERLATAAAQARELVASDEETAALEMIRSGQAALGRLEGVDKRLDAVGARLGSCGFELEEIARELREYAEGTEFDPGDLDAAEARVALINDLKRKYGTTIEEILAFAEDASSRLARLDSTSGELQALEAETVSLEHELAALGRELREARLEAASRFEKELAQELADLNMDKAQFVVAIADRRGSNGDSYGPTGADDVEFFFSASAGEAPRELTKIASGGEISRVMLAAKTVLGTADDVSTLVFDEIDVGVGGKTAAAVGAKLGELARSHQVICVTHLPQIACTASRHFCVTKREAGGRTATAVSVLDEKERVGEIARMLSGEKVSETSVKHAREMLARRSAGA